MYQIKYLHPSTDLNKVETCWKFKMVVCHPVNIVFLIYTIRIHCFTESPGSTGPFPDLQNLFQPYFQTQILRHRCRPQCGPAAGTMMFQWRQLSRGEMQRPTNVAKTSSKDQVIFGRREWRNWKLRTTDIDNIYIIKYQGATATSIVIL